jgi:hypothetical protein
MLFPATIMILMSFFVMLYGEGATYTGEYQDLGTNSTMVNGINTILGFVGVPELSIWSQGMFGGGLIIMLIAVGAGILTGLDISLFGSGIKLSETGQKLLFQFLFFGGMWIALSGALLAFIIGSSLMTMFYTGLTVMYAFGFAFNASNTLGY